MALQMKHATITCVVGRRGFGKSEHLKRALLPAIDGPVVVFDPKGEYGIDEGFIDEFYDADAFLDAAEERGFWRASCRFNAEDTALSFAALYHFTPHTIVVEEAHQYMSPNKIEPGLDRLIRMGRLPSVSIVLVTQRARDFPQIIYTMADHIVVFQQRGEHDMRALEFATDEDVEDVETLPRDAFRNFDMTGDGGAPAGRNIKRDPPSANDYPADADEDAPMREDVK
jgi:hypothetical protein